MGITQEVEGAAKKTQLDTLKSYIFLLVHFLSVSRNIQSWDLITNCKSLEKNLVNFLSLLFTISKPGFVRP